MKIQSAQLAVRIYGIDGSVRTFIQHDPQLVNHLLAELNPAHLFLQDRIVLADQESRATFLPPLVTRVDLVTPRLSVWDFPFHVGAPVEMTRPDFLKTLETLPSPNHDDPASESTVLLDLEMVDGRRTLLQLQRIAGFPRHRLSKVYSLFKQRRLVFGLPRKGVGILNLANLLNFSVYPAPQGGAPTESQKRPSSRLVPSTEIQDPWSGGKWNAHPTADESDVTLADGESELRTPHPTSHAG